jgi:hypothetical protein
MKPKSAKSVVLSFRCTHLTSDGRQCRRLASDAQSGLCLQHRAEQKQVEAADHFPYLSRNFQYFQTAQGINYSLMNLYQLLAQNRISPRRAAVLSYISSLLLRSLPQIDADNAAGIKFQPKNLTVAEPQPVTAPGCGEDTALDSASGSGGESLPGSGSLDTWDPSNAEPDLKKKPS